MTKAIYSIIKNLNQAEQVIEQLRNAGFSNNDITILYNQKIAKQNQQESSQTRTKGKENFQKESTTPHAIPNTSTINVGQNTYVGSGHLLNLLKTASTNPNALTTIFTKMGLSEQEVTRFLEKLKDQNSVLIGVQTNTNNIDKAKMVFEKNHAVAIISTAEFAGSAKKDTQTKQW